MQASDGNLYGATAGYGGLSTVYTLRPDGTLAAVHAFPFNVGPIGRLAESADGQLVGVTNYGGVYGYGSIYGLAPRTP